MENIERMTVGCEVEISPSKAMPKAGKWISLRLEISPQPDEAKGLYMFFLNMQPCNCVFI